MSGYDPGRRRPSQAEEELAANEALKQFDRETKEELRDIGLGEGAEPPARQFPERCIELIEKTLKAV